MIFHLQIKSKLKSLVYAQPILFNLNKGIALGSYPKGRFDQTFKRIQPIKELINYFKPKNYISLKILLFQTNSHNTFLYSTNFYNIYSYF